MNKHSLLWGFISIIWIGAGSSYVGNLACSALDSLAPLSLIHGDLELQSTDHFQFGLSSAEISFGPSTKTFFADLAGFLKENPSKVMSLNGLYLPEELNHTDFEDLGIARGNSVKSALVHFGASSSQINIASEELIKNPMVDNILFDGVIFNISSLPAISEKSNSTTQKTESNFTATDVSAPLAKEFVEPMTLYGDAVFGLDMNPSMQHYIDKIGAYLSDHPDSKLQITGHTQELGSIVKNADRSLELARKVRRFFRNNGINFRRIKTNAKGATEPILTPQYPQAETKNNRVEIQIID